MSTIVLGVHDCYCADVRYIQAMLAHENLDTTQMYTHVSNAKLQAAHAATHPAARLGRRSADEGEDSPVKPDAES